MAGKLRNSENSLDLFPKAEAFLGKGLFPSRPPSGGQERVAGLPCPADRHFLAKRHLIPWRCRHSLNRHSVSFGSFAWAFSWVCPVSPCPGENDCRGGASQSKHEDLGRTGMPLASRGQHLRDGIETHAKDGVAKTLHATP